MPEYSLIDRFTFGQARLAFPDADGSTERQRFVNEILTESPKRQRAIISLAHHQLASQERQAAMLATSTLVGANLVANEISQQATQLRGVVEQVGDRLSEDIVMSTVDVTSAIDELGSHLTMELAEVRWQLAQQNDTLGKILHVLHESRSNEARQLVAQGQRLYDAEQYEKAEERFRQALHYDMTDYQVLVYLGRIELRKGRADTAFAFFQDALTLPPNLDVAAKALTLWDIAVLASTAEKYEEAIHHGDLSLSLGKKSANLYETAIWAAWCGRAADSVGRLREAIEMNPSLLGRATVDLGFEPIRVQVMDLLSSMAREAEDKAKAIAAEIAARMQDIVKGNGSNQCESQINRMRIALANWEELLSKPSYSSCVKYAENMGRALPLLTNAGILVCEIGVDCGESEVKASTKHNLSQSLRSCEARCKELPDLPLPDRLFGLVPTHLGCAVPLLFFGAYAIFAFFVQAVFVQVNPGNLVWGVIFVAGGAYLVGAYYRRCEGVRHHAEKRHLAQEISSLDKMLTAHSAKLTNLRKQLDSACDALDSL
jgi:tetratricopeptide (TPR) repeat protein